MHAVIEIRTYQLREGTAERFHQAMQEQSLALLRAAGTDVLAACPSLDDPCAYLLVRAYPSRAARQASQAAFYGSPAWLQGPCELILGSIAHYHTVLVAAEPATIEAMRRIGA